MVAAVVAFCLRESVWQLAGRIREILARLRGEIFIISSRNHHRLPLSNWMIQFASLLCYFGLLENTRKSKRGTKKRFYSIDLVCMRLYAMIRSAELTGLDQFRPRAEPDD